MCGSCGALRELYRYDRYRTENHFVFYGYGDHRDLHSFPTRRSSDLITGRVPGRARGELALLEQQHIAPAELRQVIRSEEHTSELQSLTNLVCRLLLEKKKSGHPAHAHKLLLARDGRDHLADIPGQAR